MKRMPNMVSWLKVYAAFFGWLDLPPVKAGHWAFAGLTGASLRRPPFAYYYRGRHPCLSPGARRAIE
jgi:hypothetical protein